MAKAKKPSYALVKGIHGGGHYAHLEISFMDIIPYSYLRLKISCQTGGCETSRSYGWKYGFEPSSGMLTTAEMHEGYLYMRRLDKGMLKFYDKDGSAQSFAEYAARVITLTGTKVVYVNEHVDQGIRGEVTDLPSFSPIKNSDALRMIIQKMEDDIRHRTR